MFQVKAISEDVRKMNVLSFMFLFNLSKSAVEIINKYTFSCKGFVLYRK